MRKEEVDTPPIQKIILSTEDLKVMEKSENPVVFVGIPAGTDPGSTGTYVLKAMQEQGQSIYASGDTANAITFVAQQGAK